MDNCGGKKQTEWLDFWGGGYQILPVLGDPALSRRLQWRSPELPSALSDSVIQTVYVVPLTSKI